MKKILISLIFACLLLSVDAQIIESTWGSWGSQQQVHAENAEQELSKWKKKLERALVCSLGQQIDDFERALKGHPNADNLDVERLVHMLRNVSAYRNPLCHGSWGAPDGSGQSNVFFVDRKLRQFTSKIDIDLLQNIQTNLTQVICEVTNSVVLLGCRPITDNISFGE